MNMRYCTVCEKVVQSDGSCEKWQPKKSAGGISLKTLNDAEEDIVAIKKMLKDN